ncbi:Hsp33 family molecular chaperone HslO [Vogesella sp. AC12]|uniref:Hsp33 family molecular chaperone HslO n=1 Tax=Vogesella sp. AC12 TaxID=2950550 RepID=UPI00210D51E9|nr:Hsp33 family molecular chaperone HslO [Vogesella sp. AC12]MCQ4145172.1 Hsp33 family molecular chaperone HslO [Vogesella sp. AC12]
MNQADTLQRFLFDGVPVRGALVRLDGAWQQVVTRHNYPAAVRHVLGQMVAASSLLAANLKFDGTLIMQLHGKGALRLAVAECTSERTVRATARFDAAITDAPLAELLGEGGTFVVTLEPKEGEPWQGIVALEGDSIAQMLENYMQRSEQLDTRLILACNDDTAAGLLLQRLPDGHGDVEGWPHVVALADTLQQDELLTLGADDILYRLYHQETVRVFDPAAVSFACNCSEERVGEMLKLLGGQEAADVVLEQGSIEIGCEYCGQRYVFDEDDVNRLFNFDVMAAVREARH